jgi:hypothetical protein
MISKIDANNIYYFYSSFAQAIAAFVGLVTAGFIFSHDRILKGISDDETMEEIQNEIITQNYRKLKWLFILTGFAISLNLFVVYLNGYELGYYNLTSQVVVAILDFFTLFLAINFVLSTTRPDRIKTTAKKLIDENEKLFRIDVGRVVSLENFVTGFMRLEKLLRQLAISKELISPSDSAPHTPLVRIIRLLKDNSYITANEYDTLKKLSKIRNLAVHGNIDEVESDYIEEMEKIENEMQLKINH